ncbi:unnamed protein product [Discula destructiva]
MPVQECASPAHSSQQSTSSEQSDTDSDGCKINVHTPAVVAWEGQHTKLDLFIQYDRSTSTAFLKLRASLVLKALPPAKSYLYVFIPPERIRTLTLDDSPDPDSVPSDTAKVLGSSFACLRFNLKAAADLIGPKFVSHKPKNHMEGRVLDQLRSLVQSTAFTVFIPSQVLSKSQLLAVCYGMSDWLLRSNPGQIDLLCLYEGRGGVKIQIGESDKAVNYSPDMPKQPCGDKPPSYTEAAPAPLIAAGDMEVLAGKKRRRLNSDAVVELGGNLLATIKQMVREEVRVQVSEEVQKLETRLKDSVVDLINKHTDAQSTQWTEELEMTRQEFDDKLEDDYLGVRMKLEDYIKDEITEAEERIIEHLQSTASVHLDFGS